MSLNPQLTDKQILGFEPRDYQDYYRNRIGEFLLSTTKKALMQSHTGTGKTKTFFMTALTVAKDLRIAFVTPRVNLTHQTLDDANELGIESEFGLVQGSKKIRPNARVVFWSLKTLENRLKDKVPKYKMDYDLIIFDECHVESKDKQVQDRIAKLVPSTTKILGLTATPYNPDATPLEFYGDAMQINKKYQDIDFFINSRFLVDIEYIKAGEAIDTSLLKPSKSGDYTDKSLDEASAGTATDISLMAHSIIQKKQLIFARRMQVLAYAQNIRHANELTQEFIKLGYSSKALHSSSSEDQLEILAQYRRGEFQVLVTVGMVGFGVDLPSVEIIVYGKRTRSHSLYRQEIGRGIRIMPLIDKELCFIIDCVNNYDELGHPFSTPHPIDPKEKGSSRVPRCEFCEEPTLSLTDEEVDEDNARLIKYYSCSSCGEENIRVAALPSFECGECKDGIYRQLLFPPVKQRNGDLVCTCPHGHHTVVGKVLPKEMFVVFRDREQGIAMITSSLENRKPSIGRDAIGVALEKNKDVLTDTLLSYSLGVAGDLKGEHTEKTLLALAKVIDRFTPFNKLTLSDKADNKIVRDIILDKVNKSKYAFMVNILNKRLVEHKSQGKKSTEIVMCKRAIGWAIKQLEGFAIQPTNKDI